MTSLRREKDRSSFSLRRLLEPYLQGQRVRLALIALLAVLAGFAEAGLLVLVAQIATSLAAGHTSTSLTLGPIHQGTITVGDMLAAAAVLLVARALFQVAGVFLATRLQVRVWKSTLQRLLGSFLNAGWPLQASQRHGRLQELITDYATFTSGALAALVTGATAAFSLAALLVTALFVNVAAAVITGIAAFLVGAFVRPLRIAARRRSRGTASSRLIMATGVTELATTLQDVRIFGVEHRVRERLDDLVEGAAQRQQSTDRMSGLITVVYQGSAMALVVGALAVAYAANYSALSSLGAMALIMIRSLTYGQVLQTSLQNLHICAPYLEALQEEESNYTAAALERGGAPVGRIKELEFEHVSFEYVPGQPALRDISFSVTPGEIVGIVGPSGSGKSTLIQLLLRLREPTTGRVMVNDRDSREFDLDEWYRARLVRPAGGPPLRRHGGREHPVLPRRRKRRGDRARRPPREPSRRDHGLAPGIRHSGGGAGKRDLGRATPTAVHRTCARHRTRHPGARRTDELARRQVRDARAGDHCEPRAANDRLRDRAPALDVVDMQPDHGDP